ncbi:MAG: aldehyde dehydrogenase family protein, partial [Alphaproteobacteria bacterium]|nr:aldehyde dehydrogenase family protein [Alphaproteobacteria bacterium]
LHSRLNETITHVTSRVKAGNLYVNRNIIGAIVGVQPFGGRGLSGTGPKAGGPLYLGHLVGHAPRFSARANHLDSPIHDFADWLDASGEAESAVVARRYRDASALGADITLPGPVGEQNLYTLHPRGSILMVAATRSGLFEQMAAVLATGNRGVVQGQPLPAGLPSHIADCFSAQGAASFAAAIVEGDEIVVFKVARSMAKLSGPIVPVYAAQADHGLAYQCDWLLEEVSISINTTAAGGNASLMMIG